MNRIWEFFFQARGRTDLRGRLEYWLFCNARTYNRFYWLAVKADDRSLYE